jgi:uncharacterized protein YneF (UPF0154 family)
MMKIILIIFILLIVFIVFRAIKLYIKEGHAITKAIIGNLVQQNSIDFSLLQVHVLDVICYYYIILIDNDLCLISTIT